MRCIWFILLIGLMVFLVGCSSPTEPNTNQPLITDAGFNIHFTPDIGYSGQTWIDVSRECNWSFNYWVNDEWWGSQQGSAPDSIRIIQSWGVTIGSTMPEPTGKTWRILWTAGDETREFTGIFTED